VKSQEERFAKLTRATQALSDAMETDANQAMRKLTRVLGYPPSGPRASRWTRFRWWLDGIAETVGSAWRRLLGRDEW
jgi:hypothetical protein